MYASPFRYHRASSIAEARQLLATNPGAKLLAGGHSLLPLMKLRLANPDVLIDIGSVAELKGITPTSDGFRIGAATTHAAIAASAELRAGCAVVAATAGRIGDPAVRNRGTIGGNIAHADPASDLPAVLVALDAQVVATGPSGERTLPAVDFFTGLMMTALSEDEVVTAVLVPASPAWRGSTYVKFAHPASRYAVVGVAAAVRMQAGTCQEARVALGGLVPHPRRAAAVEQSLAGTSADEAAITAAAGLVARDLGEDVLGDIYASAEYRAAVAPVYVARAVAAAVARAGTV